MRKGKSVLVVVILFSLCFFLTGCFDMSMVIDIKDPEEQVSAKVTLTTPSEEAFDLIKSEAYKEDLIGPDKPDAVQSKTREGEGVYSLEVKKDGQLGNTNIEVNILDDQVTYTLENIIWEGENSSENEEDMDYSSWFEGYSYEFIVSLPDKVQTAWWTDSDHNKIEKVEEKYLDGDTLSFEIPMNQMMREEKKGKWAGRWGVVIQTEK